MASESPTPNEDIGREGRSSSVPCAAWHITFGGLCLNCGEQHHSLPPGNRGWGSTGRPLPFYEDGLTAPPELNEDAFLEELEKRYYDNPLL